MKIKSLTNLVIVSFIIVSCKASEISINIFNPKFITSKIVSVFDLSFGDNGFIEYQDAFFDEYIGGNYNIIDKKCFSDNSCLLGLSINDQKYYYVKVNADGTRDLSFADNGLLTFMSLSISSNTKIAWIDSEDSFYLKSNNVILKFDNKGNEVVNFGATNINTNIITEFLIMYIAGLFELDNKKGKNIYTGYHDNLNKCVNIDNFIGEENDYFLLMASVGDVSGVANCLNLKKSIVKLKKNGHLYLDDPSNSLSFYKELNYNFTSGFTVQDVSLSENYVYMAYKKSSENGVLKFDLDGNLDNGFNYYLNSSVFSNYGKKIYFTENELVLLHKNTSRNSRNEELVVLNKLTGQIDTSKTYSIPFGSGYVQIQDSVFLGDRIIASRLHCTSSDCNTSGSNNIIEIGLDGNYNLDLGITKRDNSNLRNFNNVYLHNTDESLMIYSTFDVYARNMIDNLGQLNTSKYDLNYNKDLSFGEIGERNVELAVRMKVNYFNILVNLVLDDEANSYFLVASEVNDRKINQIIKFNKLGKRDLGFGMLSELSLPESYHLLDLIYDNYTDRLYLLYFEPVSGIDNSEIKMRRLNPRTGEIDLNYDVSLFNGDVFLNNQIGASKIKLSNGAGYKFSNSKKFDYVIDQGVLYFFSSIPSLSESNVFNIYSYNLTTSSHSKKTMRPNDFGLNGGYTSSNGSYLYPIKIQKHKDGKHLILNFEIQHSSSNYFIVTFVDRETLELSYDYNSSGHVKSIKNYSQTIDNVYESVSTDLVSIDNSYIYINQTVITRENSGQPTAKVYELYQVYRVDYSGNKDDIFTENIKSFKPKIAKKFEEEYAYKVDQMQLQYLGPGLYYLISQFSVGHNQTDLQERFYSRLGTGMSAYNLSIKNQDIVMRGGVTDSNYISLLTEQSTAQKNARLLSGDAKYSRIIGKYSYSIIATGVDFNAGENLFSLFRSEYIED